VRQMASLLGRKEARKGWEHDEEVSVAASGDLRTCILRSAARHAAKAQACAHILQEPPAT
jgi:hypothetical protein